MYTHNGGGGTLTANANLSGLNTGVRSIHWNKNGICLALGRDAGSGTEFETYSFDDLTNTFSKVSSYEFQASVQSSRWSPSGCHLISGVDLPGGVGIFPMLNVYKGCCAENCCDSLRLRIEALETCCEQMGTSTSFLQSQIDVINASGNIISSVIDVLVTSTESLNSQIKLLNSCCDDLRTSTGFLQSQIDAVRTMSFSPGGLISMVDSLGSHYDDLRTSTGFLQSQIDNLMQVADNIQQQVSSLEVSSIVTYTYQPVLVDSASLAPLSWLNGGIKLLDATTTVSLNTPFSVRGVVDLNCGTLVLSNDFLLNNISALLGGGTIVGNNHVFDLSPSVTSVGPSLVPGKSFIFKDITLNLNADLELLDTLIFMGC